MSRASRADRIERIEAELSASDGWIYSLSYSEWYEDNYCYYRVNDSNTVYDDYGINIDICSHEQLSIIENLLDLK